MTLWLESAGFFTTIQDAGRFGYEKFGVPCAGPMDRFALHAANLLVGNLRYAAGLEVGMSDVSLVCGEDCLVALTGAGYDLHVDGRPMPRWIAILARRGAHLALRKTSGGNWGYLGISGGIATPLVMGSRATYLRGKLGGLNGGPLQDGDALPLCPQPASFLGLAGKLLPPPVRPAYSDAPVLEVIPGPQDERFTPAGIETFYSSVYQVSPTSDRMGLRLEGAPVAHTRGADILSDGMSFGSVQVPASGQPIVMMSEHPTTGGYTKIATVASADLPVLAQCPPGASTVRFRQTTVAAAQERYRRQVYNLERSLQESEEETLAYIG